MPTRNSRCDCTGCSSSWAECPVHGDVDSILASGRYVDRRGREWLYDPDFDIWVVSVQTHEYVTNIEGIIDPAQMRLMIERDQHRDVCPGLRDCDDHPVPNVVSYGGAAAWDVWGPGDWYVCSRPSLPEAFAAALQFALDRGSEHPSGTGAE